MYIEGAKNGPTTLGTVVQDNVALLSGYSLYVWGSVILDKLIAGLSNNAVVFQLLRAETPDANIADATLVEQIILYPATESTSNLDDNAQAGLITRATAVRVGNFETSQSLMFSPISIDTSDDGKTVTYFLRTINREVEDDEVCLSLVIWAGAEGIGAKVPGDPFVPPLPDVFPHKNCFYHRPITAGPGGDARWLYSEVPETHRLIGNTWSIGIWFRPDTTFSDNFADPVNDPQMIFNGGSLLDTGTPATDKQRNRIQIFWTLNRTGPTDLHRLNIICFEPSGLSGAGSGEWESRDIFDSNGVSDIFPAGAADKTNFNGGWHFLVVTFRGDTTNNGKYGVYMNGNQLLPTLLDSSTKSMLMDDTFNMGYSFGVSTIDITNAGEFSGPNVHPADIAIGRTHQIGMWNIDIDRTNQGSTSTSDDAILYLYNSGRGTEIDWRVNSTAVRVEDGAPIYPYANNLVHMNQLGAAIADFDDGFIYANSQARAHREWNEDSSGTRAAPGRDVGNHLFRGDMSFTRRGIVSNAGDNTRSMDSNTTMADFLSPDGELGTTQATETYPGSTL